MTQQQAEAQAQTLFGKGIESVRRYTEPIWHDKGWSGFRVTMGDKERTIHWMTPRGRHEEEVCCKPERKKTMREAMHVKVVRR